MMLKCIVGFLAILLVQVAYSQKVEVKIKANQPYSNEAKNIRFTVQIKNKKFPEYYVQDTLYIQRYPGSPAFIFPYVERKEKGKYVYREFARLGGNLVPDSCRSDCCNCFLLKKGDSTQFNLDLLMAFKLDKGEYRIYVLLHPPGAPKKINMNVYAEVQSNYVYFTVK